MPTLHLAPLSARETIAQIYQSFGRRDIPNLLTLLSPECEIEQTPLLPWGGHFVGYEGVLRFLEHLTTTINSSPEAQQWIEADDHVLVVGRIRGHILANGRGFDLPFVHDWTLRNGRVHRFVVHIDTPTMLQLLAQQEEDGSPHSKPHKAVPLLMRDSETSDEHNSVF